MTDTNKEIIETVKKAALPYFKSEIWSKFIAEFEALKITIVDYFFQVKQEKDLVHLEFGILKDGYIIDLNLREATYEMNFLRLSQVTRITTTSGGNFRVTLQMADGAAMSYEAVGAENIERLTAFARKIVNTLATGAVK